MSVYDWLWAVWFAAFFAIELPAFLDGIPGGTLSENVWRIFSVRGKGVMWRTRRGILIMALGLLFYHFVSGGGWFLIE